MWLFVTGLFYSAYFKVQIATCASSSFPPIAKQYPSYVLASFSSVGIWVISTPTPTLSHHGEQLTWPVTPAVPDTRPRSPAHVPQRRQDVASLPNPWRCAALSGLFPWCRGTLGSTPVQPALQTTADGRVTPSKGSIPTAPTTQGPDAFQKVCTYSHEHHAPTSSPTLRANGYETSGNHILLLNHPQGYTSMDVCICFFT